MITIEDFGKLEIKIGKILSSERVEGTEKLLRLEVDFGSESGIGTRQIVSGIAQFYNPEELVGKLCPFLVNLEPRMLKGIESQGMLVAASVAGNCVLLHPDTDVP